MKTFDVLDPKLDLNSSRFLEASAGTGKTFAIEQLVLRMLQQEEGPKIDEILIVTFTRAATRELKTRIRKTIQDSVVQENRLRQALASFDEAKIFTIHGFCFHTLQQFAFDVGFSLDQTEESADPTLLTRIVKDFLRGPLPIDVNQLDIALRSCRNDVEALAKKISSTRETPNLPDLAALINRLKRSVDPELFHEELVARAVNYKGMCNRSKQVKDEEGLHQFAHLFSRPIDLAGSPFLLMCGENLIKKPKEITSHYPGLFEELQRELLPALRKHSDPQQIIALLAQEAQQKIERVKKKEGLIIFDDLLEMVQKNISKIAPRLRAQYKAVLIDEFQDTDPIQWEIFSTVFLTKEFAGPLFLIGDPKQSIYRFRNADIYTYLQAKEQMGEEKVATLCRNFRSEPQLIAALNHLFTRAGKWIELPKLGQQFSCPPVLADESRQNTKWEDGKKSAHLCEARDENSLFAWMIAEIQSLPLPFSEIAILVKDRYQQERIVFALRQAGIPTQTKRARPLHKSYAYQLLLEWLSAISEPHNEAFVMRTQGGPLFAGKVDAEFFAALRKILEERDIVATFAHYLQDYENILLSHEEGEQILCDLWQLVELLEERGSDLTSLQQMQFEDEQIEALQARQHLQQQAIPIMTMHVSKGLEFSVVFPIGLCVAKAETCAEEEAEKMRQLYVALTRAKKRLYLLRLANQSGAPIDRFLQRIDKLDDILLSTSTDRDLATPIARDAPQEEEEKPSKIELPNFERKQIQSFSSLVAYSPLQVETHEALPSGVKTGLLLHELFEKLDFQTRDLERDVISFLEGTHLVEFGGEIVRMAELALSKLGLREVDPTKMLKEMPFLYPSQEGFMTGVIDLVYEREGLLHFLDWKSNELDSYEPEHLKTVMEHHDYLLQGAIYSRALRAYADLFPGAEMGGYHYVFLRGLCADSCDGIFSKFPCI